MDVKILIVHSARICSYHKAILSLYQDKIQELNTKLTVSVVDMDDTLWNLVFEPDDCLLSIESLKEKSLCDTVTLQPLLGPRERQCRQGTFSARVSLWKIMIFLQNSLFLNLSYWLFEWVLSPVFRVNNCINERMVDGWCLRYNSGNSFGIGAEDASIPKRCKEKTCISFVMMLVLQIFCEVSSRSW